MFNSCATNGVFTVKQLLLGIGSEEEDKSYTWGLVVQNDISYLER